MKTLHSLQMLAFLAICAVGNLFSTALAQDTLYIYHGGMVVYKRAVLQIDSMSYTPPAKVEGVAGKDTQTAVVDVTNPATGKTWMDRNLCATRAATGSSDADAYGDLYQWGRAADGHENRNSPIAEMLSTGDSPGHGNFIVSAILP